MEGYVSSRCKKAVKRGKASVDSLEGGGELRLLNEQ